MIPICIPTYKHPRYDFIDKVLTSKYFANRKFKKPVYYFIYDIDWDSFKIEDYLDKFEEIHFVKVPFQSYAKAMRMRVFIQLYMTNLNMDYFWMLDNDICQNITCMDRELHRMVQKPIDEVLEYIESFRRDNILIMGPSNRWTAPLSSKTDSDLDEGKSIPIQCILLNNKELNKLGINYTGDISVCEDAEICIRCIDKGYDCRMLKSFVYHTASNMATNNWYNLNEIVKNTYQKYKHTGLVELGQTKRGANIIKISRARSLKHLRRLW